MPIIAITFITIPYGITFVNHHNNGQFLRIHRFIQQQIYPLDWGGSGEVQLALLYLGYLRLCALLGDNAPYGIRCDRTGG